MLLRQEMEKHECNSEVHLAVTVDAAIILHKKIKSQEEKIEAQDERWYLKVHL